MAKTMRAFFFILFNISNRVVGLKVSGNKFIDEEGNRVILRGVSHSGSEYGCVQTDDDGNAKPILEGGTDASAVAAIASWGNNVVRVPLNEDCWLGINGVQYSASEYQAAIHSFVDTLLAGGIYVILDLHWTAPDTTLASGQQAMPNSDHSIDAWKSIATTFNYSQNILFELFNEPFPGETNVDSDQWQCWKIGDCDEHSSGVTFEASGMVDLVYAVRNDVGSRNIILLGALEWSNNLGRWLDYVPTDPLKNMAAVFHGYDYNECVSENCWVSTLAPILAEVPLIATETGGATTFVKSLWAWLDTHHASYLAWTWNVWNDDQSLISDYAGTPTDPWGKDWSEWLSLANDDDDDDDTVLDDDDSKRNDDIDDDDDNSIIDDDNDCIDTYEQCDGLNYDGPTTCCASTDICTYSNDYYSSCRPTSNDDGIVVRSSTQIFWKSLSSWWWRLVQFRL